MRQSKRLRTKINKRDILSTDFHMFLIMGFPNDVVIHMLKMLPLDQLCVLFRLNKHWHKTLSTDVQLFRTIDGIACPTLYKVDFTTMKYLIGCAGERLIDLRLTMSGNYAKFTPIEKTEYKITTGSKYCHFVEEFLNCVAKSKQEKELERLVVVYKYPLHLFHILKQTKLSPTYLYTWFNFARDGERLNPAIHPKNNFKLPKSIIDGCSEHGTCTLCEKVTSLGRSCKKCQVMGCFNCKERFIVQCSKCLENYCDKCEDSNSNFKRGIEYCQTCQ